MFIHDTHLPQLLPPATYTSREQFRREVDALLLPAWHCVAATSDIPRDGDFVTCDLLGHPLILWNRQGKIRAFLNVCAHRFCTVTGKARGSCPRLRCQYHGWEYDEHGDTQKIPDAASFRPLRRGELGLVPFPADTVGQLIFVRLAETGPSLCEFLGQQYDKVRDWFSDAYRPIMSYTAQAAANWKAYIENGLESYHINMVHAATFVCWPDDRTCEHELGDTWTTFKTVHEDPRHFYRAADAWARRILRDDVGPYEHVHVYPGFTFIRMSVFTYLESVLPVSPGETSVVTRGFCRAGTGSLASRLVHSIMKQWGARFLKIVQDEDIAVLRPCQRGLSSPRHPRGGLISIREERIHHFQEYIHRHTIASGGAECPQQRKTATP